MNNTSVYVLLCLFLGLSQSATGEDVDYTRDIKPILKSKCYGCHGALKQEGSLRTDTADLIIRGGDSGPAIDRKKPLRSLLWERVAAEDPVDRMPPDGEPMSPEQLERFREWLVAGARAPADEKPQQDPASHWSFQPLQVAAPDSSHHSIDEFVQSRLAESGLKMADRADPVALVRRCFLDLHGLPTSPEDLDRWLPQLSGDQEQVQQAVAKLVDELLRSPRYGERWAQHWLDVVRYADTHGYEVNTPRPNAWHYRDYVIDAFNNDTPYDQFIREQLVGDSLKAPRATGFLVAAAALLPGQIGKDEASKRQARQDELDEIIVGTSATFLGLTVGCARCHDHKFDPISQEDYYAFQAFFAGVKYGERDIRDEAFAARLAEAEALQPRVRKLRQQLSEFAPSASTRQTLIIDDEDPERVTILAPIKGHGQNPKGTKRGYREDSGSASRSPNISGGRYTWWANDPGKDVFTWNPAVAGTFRIWVSWGVHGSEVHTNDARYVLDLDGDLSTKTDQKQIAEADQHYFAGVAKGKTEKKPLWSGLLDAGVHELRSNSRVVLRCGNSKTGITADAIVLQKGEVNSTPESALPRLRPAVRFHHNVDHFAATPARFVRFTSLATVDDNRHQPCIDELQIFAAETPNRNVALSNYGTKVTSSGNYSTEGKHQLPHVNDGRLGNDFSWISNEHGRGWVQLEFPQVETIDRIEWSRDRTGKFKDRLPIRYTIETSLDGTNWQVVATSDDREPLGTPFDQISSLLRNTPAASRKDVTAVTSEIRRLEKRVQQLRTPTRIFAGRFEGPEDTFLLNRGDPEQRIEEVTPHVLSALDSLELSKESADVQRRTKLAAWIASEQNPLTARVIVNRVWQYHFGTGLVATPSDFGLNGAKPSHPKLLDWLTVQFVESGWSIKDLHRTIMTSSAYMQAATVETSLATIARKTDADNRLLWRFPSRRLEAEAIRDSILHVTGQLNLKTGGPGFDFFKSRGGLSGFPPIDKFEDEHKRRMVYAHKVRMEPVPIFGTFDCPDAGLPTPRRSQSTTALQALSLFNSGFVIEQAKVFAERIARESGDDVAMQIGTAFRIALGRFPSESEASACEKVVRDFGLQSVCRVLLNTNEFLFLP